MRTKNDSKFSMLHFPNNQMLNAADYMKNDGSADCADVSLGDFTKA